MYIYYENKDIKFINKELFDIGLKHFEVSDGIGHKLSENIYEIIEIPESTLEKDFDKYFKLKEVEIANPEQVMSKQIADLAIDNKKKDILIQNLAKTERQLVN